MISSSPSKTSPLLASIDTRSPSAACPDPSVARRPERSMDARCRRRCRDCRAAVRQADAIGYSPSQRQCQPQGCIGRPACSVRPLRAWRNAFSSRQADPPLRFHSLVVNQRIGLAGSVAVSPPFEAASLHRAIATSEHASTFPVDRYRNMAVIDHLLRLAANQHGREATAPMGSHHDHVGLA